MQIVFWFKFEFHLSWFVFNLSSRCEHLLHFGITTIGSHISPLVRPYNWRWPSSCLQYENNLSCWHFPCWCMFCLLNAHNAQWMYSTMANRALLVYAFPLKVSRPMKPTSQSASSAFVELISVLLYIKKRASVRNSTE